MQEALHSNFHAERLNWTCPEVRCEYRMGLKPRMPDFRRHLKAHLREQNQAAGVGHICKGILMTDFNNLSDMQRDAILRADCDRFVLNGEERIGGCQQTFSRGDALTRHVKSGANPCVGWVSGSLKGC
ncbi:hypothetical protein NMY22_g14103 [Coprinellus aureogranulatus]|nr:hypothetical protein NMY22_g14103 [Coprinellus aureogranulatus]